MDDHRPPDDPERSRSADDAHIVPVVAEQAEIGTRETLLEHVRVRAVPIEVQELLQAELRHEQVEVRRVPVGREVAQAPAIRTEGDTVIMPVLEERLVVEKRLVLVEEIHLTRLAGTRSVEMPVSLRRMQVEIDRENLGDEEAVR